METFNRIEKKYVLDEYQYHVLIDEFSNYLSEDKYHYSEITSIYYDLDDFRMLSRSIEHPDFKEKIRIRTYEKDTFLEIKRKLNDIVYKRRIKVDYPAILDIENYNFGDTQIEKEITSMLNYYPGLKPRFYINVKRYAYVNKKYGLRITFDLDLNYRRNNMTLVKDGTESMISNKVIMEIKANGAYPVWLCRILDNHHAYPRGFSKVGEAYLKELEVNRNEFIW